MSIITEIQQCQDEAREGWMPEKKSAPDFGEPWKKSILTGFIETKHGDAAHTAADRMSRVITCVNACAGMADPAKEIQAMREAIKEAHYALAYVYNHGEGSCTFPYRTDDDLCSENRFYHVKDALDSLKPFIP